jgi:magnesium chelatase family protein
LVVEQARAIQTARYASMNLPVRTNAQVSGDALQQVVALTPDGRQLLEDANTRLKLSMRGLTRVLRIARTIADLAGSDTIAAVHVAEAVQYRRVLKEQ